MSHYLTARVMSERDLFILASIATLEVKAVIAACLDSFNVTKETHSSYFKPLLQRAERI